MHTLRKSKTVLFGALTIGAVFAMTVFFDVQDTGNSHNVQATSTATTTVRVLNTPPVWTITAREYYASATSTPTNAGTSTWWTARATDSNAENYYLLICKSSSTPVAVNSGAPRCGGGGIDQWAVSGPTPSGADALVSTTTQDAWATKNDWYAYVCDPNEGSPRCNAAQYNGLHEPGPASATSSPFVVNHRPTLTTAADNSPTAPGATTTWTSTSFDSDGDTVKLHVCKAQDFIPASGTAGACGAGGFWASSTYALNNVSAEGYITPPAQDTDHGAYVYLVDMFGSVSTSAWNSSSTVLTVMNVAPYVATTTIQVYNVFGTTTSDQALALTVEEGQTDNFVVEFDVVDDNSCLNASAGNEITDANINVFRYDDSDPYTRSLLCNDSGEYNVNWCYTDTNPFFTPTCYQVPGTCAGAGDDTARWECTFSLWYVADPTDLLSQYQDHDWRASASALDEALASPYSTYNGGVDVGGSANMMQFLSFRATGTPIAYGQFEPGFGNTNHTASTTVYATGNTGLDHYLSGDAMCVGYPIACTGYATSTIYVPYQHYSLTEGALYAAGTALSTSTAPVRVNADIPKPTATSSPTSDKTYWAILVPSTITYAGDYIGRNYIDGVVALSAEW